MAGRIRRRAVLLLLLLLLKLLEAHHHHTGRMRRHRTETKRICQQRIRLLLTELTQQRLAVIFQSPEVALGVRRRFQRFIGPLLQLLRFLMG